jgi:hypothetical protein
MSMSVDPTHIIAPTPSPALADHVAEREAQAADAHGRSTLMQQVDQLSISSGAKHAIEDTMVAQQYTLYNSGMAGNLTSEQRQYIFNGSLNSAVQNYAAGQGSLFDIGTALYERGQRIDQVIAGTAPVSQSGGSTPPPVATPDTQTTTGSLA